MTFGVSYFEHRILHKKTHLFCHMTFFFIDLENNPSHDIQSDSLDMRPVLTCHRIRHHQIRMKLHKMFLYELLNRNWLFLSFSNWVGLQSWFWCLYCCDDSWFFRIGIITWHHFLIPKKYHYSRIKVTCDVFLVSSSVIFDSRNSQLVAFRMGQTVV